MIISDQQKKAISHKNGPALVLAVPGSGKTTVLLNRIIYLNNTQSVEYKQILNLTFSKTQATDMKTRFDSMTSNNKAVFSTIHAFAFNVIKLFSKKYKINLKLIEGNNIFNKYKLLKRIFYENYKSPPSNDDLDYFFANYSLMKNNMLNIDNFNSNHFINIAIKYEDYKKKNNLFDFDDMLTYAYNILKNNDDILRIIKRNYKYFQLDEGQDASLIQFKILELIAYPENNIYILADDDQSIYSFRGANPEYLLKINSIFKDIKYYYLNKNYRSTKDIVMLSDYIIKNNKERYLKTVESHNDEKTPIQIIKVKNIETQNIFISNKIFKLNNKENLAILFRNNISAYAIAFDLIKNKIQFNKRLNFNNNSLNIVLQDLNNIIDFALDNSNLELFKSIYYKLNLYLKKDYIYGLNIGFNKSILDTILDDSYIKEYQKELVENLKFVLDKVVNLNLYNSIKLIFEELGYIEYISKHFENIPIKYIQEIILYFAKDYNTINELLKAFKNIESTLKNKNFNTSNIFISTIHQSKGLEYDNVLLIDLVDGEFPIYSDKASNLEEERRLFYVGITRAKKQLYLVFPKYRYNTKVKPSKFFNEIKKINK
ncbi:ATP-dependent helicase [Miniphocaeibacter halophilus]|uniref:ATP-dependent helicase n=1 Tax=Miniphocaeibacter halophilus TaxID=2931922 RepID=A0AC61MQ92_9FIRM|nr:ATP-dependent helicase [Miniphocaeibacter halophilus]QQK07776.1 ATP-dependent helicase [Miniphocaeibacter halophilus]